MLGIRLSRLSTQEPELFTSHKQTHVPECLGEAGTHIILETELEQNIKKKMCGPVFGQGFLAAGGEQEVCLVEITKELY